MADANRPDYSTTPFTAVHVTDEYVVLEAGIQKIILIHPPTGKFNKKTHGRAAPLHVYNITISGQIS